MSITFADVQAAARRLAGVAHVTPVLSSRQADALVGPGTHLFFKAENLQRGGAFKFRGAYNALAQLTSEERVGGAITYSSGNHAQAVALSASLLEMPAVIVMPSDAPKSKRAATQAYLDTGKHAASSQIHIYDRQTEDRAAIAARLAAERRMTLIPPYDHLHVMAGQGTVAMELIEQCGGHLDFLFVCVGGGGLLSGCAVAAKALCPNICVIGVEPETGNDVQQSMRQGHIVKIPTPATICDGAQTQYCGSYCFPLIQANVQEIVTVSDSECVDMMKFFAERMKIVVEPTGAMAAAAAVKLKDRIQGKRVGITISGGNVDLDRFVSLLAQ